MRDADNEAMALIIMPLPFLQISGHGSIVPHLSKLYGIRNGIDPELWDPEDDVHLPLCFDSGSSTLVGPSCGMCRTHCACSGQIRLIPILI